MMSDADLLSYKLRSDEEHFSIERIKNLENCKPVIDEISESFDPVDPLLKYRDQLNDEEFATISLIWWNVPLYAGWTIDHINNYFMKEEAKKLVHKLYKFYLQDYEIEKMINCNFVDRGEDWRRC